MLTGPLSDHQNYLRHIAMANFIDYNNLVRGQESAGKNKVPDQFKRLRLFLNTMESLNNVPEYFFHDVKSSQGWDDKDLNSVLGKIREKHPILRDIEQIANAYKHSIRRQNRNLQASDMQDMKIKSEFKKGDFEVSFDFESIVDDSIASDAWHFWRNYAESGDINILLPDA